MRITSLPILLGCSSLALSEYFIGVVNASHESYTPTWYPKYNPTTWDDDGHAEDALDPATAAPPETEPVETTVPQPPKTDPPPTPPVATTTAAAPEPEPEPPITTTDASPATAAPQPRTSKIIGSFPDGVPGSGYGCDRTCGGPDNDDSPDVYYTIRASLETYEVPGSEDIDGFPADREPGPVSMFTRTWTGVSEESSQPFCDGGYDGTTGALGPCIKVLPGQKVKIRVINDMNEGMTILKQHKATMDKYWALVAEPDWFGPLPASPAEMYITNEQDLPGWDASFDDVNIHFHGLQVVPHRFYPQGTGNPKAEWITITPDDVNEDQSCFCYVLEIPEDHPQGTFWWHIHRHGSVAMQAWQGMVGLLQVGDETRPGAPEYELAEQGIVRKEFIAIWEWVVMPNRRVNGNSSTFYEGRTIHYIFNMCLHWTESPNDAFFGGKQGESSRPSELGVVKKILF